MNKREPEMKSKRGASDIFQANISVSDPAFHSRITGRISTIGRICTGKKRFPNFPALLFRKRPEKVSCKKEVHFFMQLFPVHLPPLPHLPDKRLKEHNFQDRQLSGSLFQERFLKIRSLPIHLSFPETINFMKIYEKQEGPASELFGSKFPAAKNVYMEISARYYLPMCFRMFAPEKPGFSGNKTFRRFEAGKGFPPLFELGRGMFLKKLSGIRNMETVSGQVISGNRDMLSGNLEDLAFNNLSSTKLSDLSDFSDPSNLLSRLDRRNEAFPGPAKAWGVKKEIVNVDGELPDIRTPVQRRKRWKQKLSNLMQKNAHEKKKEFPEAQKQVAVFQTMMKTVMKTKTELGTGGLLKNTNLTPFSALFPERMVLNRIYGKDFGNHFGRPSMQSFVELSGPGTSSLLPGFPPEASRFASRKHSAGLDSFINEFRRPDRKFSPGNPGSELVFNRSSSLTREVEQNFEHMVEQKEAQIKEEVKELLRAKGSMHGHFSSLPNHEREMKEGLDISKISEQVIREISQRLKIESERRGVP